MTGIVKWFNDSKGYGYITAKDGKDIFVHWTAIQKKEFKTLTTGQAVKFDLYDTHKGLEAQNVQLEE